jgi:hypothetical protein
LPSVSFHYVRVRETDSGFVVQADAYGTLHNGETIEMALCVVVTCDGDGSAASRSTPTVPRLRRC